MAVLILAVLAFLVMRRAVPRLKLAGNLQLAMLAVPCAVAGWLLLSLIENVAFRVK